MTWENMLAGGVFYFLLASGAALVIRAIRDPYYPKQTAEKDETEPNTQVAELRKLYRISIEERFNTDICDIIEQKVNQLMDERSN